MQANLKNRIWSLDGFHGSFGNKAHIPSSGEYPGQDSNIFNYPIMYPTQVRYDRLGETLADKYAIVI